MQVCSQSLVIYLSLSVDKLQVLNGTFGLGLLV